MKRNGKRKNSRTGTYQRQGQTTPAAAPSANQLSQSANWLRRAFNMLRSLSMRAWILINLGIVGTVLGGVTHFLNGQVIVSFSKPLTSGFEFVAENDSTVSHTIENLRVTPRPGSAAIFNTTESTYLNATRAGTSLPYGNVSQVPAAAYSDLDGQVLRPKQRVTFRIPPLADWSILQPEASLVDVQYRAVPSLTILRWTAELMEGLSIMKLRITQTYLVVNGYWTPTHTNNLKAALSSACAEDVVLRQTDVCGP